MKSHNKHSFSLITKEVASKIPLINEANRNIGEPIVYAHFFGVIGDWYICELSEDRKTAFGFRNISSEKEWEMDNWLENKKGWGNFSVEDLQKMVNEEFLKEKDIRFLIVREINWEPINFSHLQVDKATLHYPGEIK